MNTYAFEAGDYPLSLVGPGLRAQMDQNTVSNVHLSVFLTLLSWVQDVNIFQSFDTFSFIVRQYLS